MSIRHYLAFAAMSAAMMPQLDNPKPRRIKNKIEQTKKQIKNRAKNKAAKKTRAKNRR